jgi:hypothetical protein
MRITSSHPPSPCLAAPSHLSHHLEMSGHCLPMSAMLDMTTGPSAPLTEFHFGGEPHVTPEPETHMPDTLDTMEDPATSQKKGSFYSDKKGKFYSMEWPSIAEFDMWHWAEEVSNLIEFRRSSNWVGGGLWTMKHLFRCGRHITGSGGEPYEIKDPGWKWVESKKTECPCHIIIKIYPHTSAILGRYVMEHDHVLGCVNVQHTTVSHDVKLLRGLSVRLERFQVMAIVWERRKMLPAELR